MAITKTVIDVNGGNNNWTAQHVLNALEDVFQTLGMNNGTNTTGVPCLVQAPSTFQSTYTEKPYLPYLSGQIVLSAFSKCGGANPSTVTAKTRYFKVKDGTNAYRMLEEFRFSYTNVNSGTNTITITRHGLNNGDEITYAVGQSADSNKNIGLTINQSYFVVNATADTIQVSDTSGGSVKNLTQASQTGFYFERKNTAAHDNATINLKLGDTINFDSSAATGSGTFNLVKNSNSYDASKLLTSTLGYQNAPTGQGTTSTEWNTAGYYQTETEALYPDLSYAEGAGTSLDDYGIVKYKYADSQNGNRNGEIVLEPFLSSNFGSYVAAYWKYTVPGTAVGLSSPANDLKLRIYRGTTVAINNTSICAITINSTTTGWSDDAVFTIPGESIGGVAGVNDLTFGANSDETVSGQKDGKPSIKVTTLGSGANFYQKSNHGSFAVAKVEHDSTKNFGTTYYGFGLAPNDGNGLPDARMVVTSGSGWRYINHEGIHSTSTSETTLDFGRYVGKEGLDYQQSFQYLSRDKEYTSNHTVLQYGNSSTPHLYPLKIIIYRDNADTDFAVLQFVQVQSEEQVPYATFSISRGTQHGSGVYDLDYVYQDSLLEFKNNATRTITFSYRNTQYTSSTRGVIEPASQYSVARAASYGYMRQASGNTTYTISTNYTNNIGTFNTYPSSSQVVTYYRNSDYDQYSNVGVSTHANYYKPMKGIPVANTIMPVPYYLPDDFVLLQVSTTPTVVEFKPGDTVTISGSEIYEVILSSVETGQTGIGSITNGSTIGMLFCARTT